MVEALSRIADCFGRDSASACELPQLMAREDAEAVWDRIFETVRTVMPPNCPRNMEQLTQEVFLWLASTRVFEAFVGEELTDEEMVSRLLAIMIDAAVD